MAPPPPEVANIIRQKMHRYGHFVDSKQWSKMDQIIHPDAKMVFLEQDGKPIQVGKRLNVFDSREAYCKQIGKFTEGGQSHHIFGFGDLNQTGPNEVSAMFSMKDRFIMGGAGGLIWSDGGGYYHEKWIKVGDDWFMSDLRLERLNVHKSFMFVVVNGLLRVAGWFGFDLTP